MIKFSEDSSIQFDKPTVYFNGGEVHTTVKWGSYKLNKIKLEALIKTADDLMELVMVKDAIDRLNVFTRQPVVLTMPYIPYARQDRVANVGEALGIKVFADMLNAMNFDKVVVSDSHSPVALALIKNVMEIPQEALLVNVYHSHSGFHSQDMVLAPDVGSLKKAKKFADKLELPLLTATKSRNTSTGMLSNVEIQFTNQLTIEYVKDRISKGGKLLIVDDICDGGGTFLGLGSALVEKGLLRGKPRDAGDEQEFSGAALLVTHGIFAKNAKVRLSKYYEVVAAAYDWTKE